MVRLGRFLVPALMVVAFPAMSADLDTWKSLLQQGDVPGVQRALAAGRPDFADSRQRGPLHLAIVHAFGEARVPILRSLLAAGAPVSARDEDGYTPLHYAAFWCPGCVRPLLDAGASVSATSRNGRTPLHGAAADSVPLLLAAGADPAARDAEGLVPLHLTPHESLLGPGIDVRGRSGLTPLHRAVLSANLDAVRWLLARGANPALETTEPYEHHQLGPEWRAKPDLIPAGQRPYDLARWRHDQTKWSTGQYAPIVAALDAATPRRSWLRR